MGSTYQVKDMKWLAGWEEIQASGQVALDPLDAHVPMHQAITGITMNGWVIEISGSDGSYRVRCLPRKQLSPWIDQWVGMSYCGDDLRAILACADYESGLLLTASSEAILDSKERARWVQS